MKTNSALTTYDDPDVAATMQVYERLVPLKEALGIEKLSVPEMQLFAMVAQHTGLDPFTKQIYAIKRGGKVTHQTGIDGYRSTAERTKEYRGSDPAEFDLCECGDPGSPAVHPSVARINVYRSYPDGIRPQPGEARWHELKPEHMKPQGAYDFLDAMWWRMPFNQLAKCAEANGLRKAFPRVLGGVYIAEEMEQDRTIEAEPAPAKKTLAEVAEEKAKAIAALEARTVEPDPRREQAKAEDRDFLEKVALVETKVLDIPEPPPIVGHPQGIVNPEEVAEGARVVAPLQGTEWGMAEVDETPRTGLTAHELVAEAKKAGKNKAHIATAIGCTLAEITERLGSMTDTERGVLADELNLDWRPK